MALELQSCGTGGTAYTQKTCVVNTATGTSEEVISMGSAPNGDTIYYTKSTAAAGKGTAWAQKGYRFNDQGQLYSLGALPRQINNPKPYLGTPVTSADPQDFQYLTDSQPGAGSWKMYWRNVFPWWENVFGVRQESMPQGALNAEDITNERGLKIGATLALLYLYAKSRQD